jgi:hypothetical protein
MHTQGARVDSYNWNYKRGGGDVEIFNEADQYKRVRSKIDTRNTNYVKPNYGVEVLNAYKKLSVIKDFSGK